jgi:hypothetical protein
MSGSVDSPHGYFHLGAVQAADGRPNGHRIADFACKQFRHNPEKEEKIIILLCKNS